MANSLQEQLLKAGLVSEAQLNRSKKQDHRAKKRSGKRSQGSEVRSQAERQRQLKAEQDKALNAKKEAQQRQRELRLQIRELVLSNAQPLEGVEVPYNVVKNGKIRRIYVTAAQRTQLAAGTLAVTTAKGRHHVIPRDTAQRIHDIMPEYFVFTAQPQDDDAANDADDPYARFKVPDDLMW